MINLGLDIDGTITRAPEFFSLLSRSTRRQRGKVHVVSSRSDEPDVRAATLIELAEYGIELDALYLLPDKNIAQTTCPHAALDWYQKFIWQKVDYSLKHDIHVFFDDEEKVLELFARYAADTRVFRALG
jgi:hypothetical protein